MGTCRYLSNIGNISENTSALLALLPGVGLGVHEAVLLAEEIVGDVLDGVRRPFLRESTERLKQDRHHRLIEVLTRWDRLQRVLGRLLLNSQRHL